DRLRPRAIYAAVTHDGLAAVRAVYPHALGEGAIDDAQQRADDPWVVTAARSGVVASFDRDGLLAAATAADATVELVAGVGEFVVAGEELLHVHGGAQLGLGALRAAVDVDEERT